VPVVRLLFVNRTIRSFHRIFKSRQKAETDSIVSKLSGLRFFHMCWLAKPAADRAVYKIIKRHQVKSIVEIGVGNGSRCEKMIQVAQNFSQGEVRYTGIDLFESRPEDQPAVSLLEMHKRLNKTGAKVKLIPGDAESSTAKVANSLANTDLFLLNMDDKLDSLNRFWFFLPRMVHDNSILLLRAQDTGDQFRILVKNDWEQFTGSHKVAANAA